MYSARCATDRNASRVSWVWLMRTEYVRPIAIASSRASIESRFSPEPKSGAVSEISSGFTSSSCSASTMSCLSSRMSAVRVSSGVTEMLHGGLCVPVGHEAEEFMVAPLDGAAQGLAIPVGFGLDGRDRLDRENRHPVGIAPDGQAF